MILKRLPKRWPFFIRGNSTRMTRIKQLKTDQISENPFDPRHPRAITIHVKNRHSFLHTLPFIYSIRQLIKAAYETHRFHSIFTERCML